MKKRRTLLLALLVLLFVVGIPTGLLVREYRREQASRDLIDAIKSNDVPAALAALKAGADANARDHFGDNPPSFRESMQKFFDNLLHPDVKSEPDYRETALPLYLRICERDNTTLVAALLNAGADPNFRPNEGWEDLPPVLQAAYQNHPHILGLLLQHGGDPQQKSKIGMTALHFAAVNHNAEALSLLLDAGADINVQNQDGETALHWVSASDYLDALHVLLQHHSALNLRTREGKTPLDWASFSDNSQINQALRNVGAKTGQELSTQSTTSQKH